MDLKIKLDFEDLHVSSQCFWTHAKHLHWALSVSPDVMRNCCCSVSWAFGGRKKRKLNKSFIRVQKELRLLQVIKKHILLFYRTWCSLLAWRIFYLLFFFFSFFFFPGRWDCVIESLWHLITEHKGTKAVTGLCFQADNAKNAWNERNHIGALSELCTSSGGSSLKSSMKGNKVRAKEVEQPWNCSILLFLFQGLGTLHLHGVVFSLKGN